MAWQMGNSEYKKKMRKKAERQDAVDAFAGDTKFNKHIRDIVQRTIGRREKPMTLREIHKYYVMFLEETAPGERVPK